MGFFVNINSNNIKTMPMRSINEIEDLYARSIVFNNGDEISLSDEFVNNTIKDYVKSCTIIQDTYDYIDCIEEYNENIKSNAGRYIIPPSSIGEKYWNAIILKNAAYAWIDTFVENKDDYIHNSKMPQTNCDSLIDNILKINPPRVKSFKCHEDDFTGCAKCVFYPLSKVSISDGCNLSICSKINCKGHKFKFM